jgi:creatinine amidohydrolase/Fe(II)-dependent formamide hydrolase-like protein
MGIDSPGPIKSAKERLHDAVHDVVESLDPAPVGSKVILDQHLGHIEHFANAAREKLPGNPKLQVTRTFIMLEKAYANGAADLERIRNLRKAINDYIEGK